MKVVVTREDQLRLKAGKADADEGGRGRGRGRGKGRGKGKGRGRGTGRGRGRGGKAKAGKNEVDEADHALAEELDGEVVEESGDEDEMEEQETPPNKKARAGKASKVQAATNPSPARRCPSKRKQPDTPTPKAKAKAKGSAKATSKANASPKAKCKANTKALSIKHAKKDKAEDDVPLTFARRYRPPKDCWSQRLWDGCVKAFRQIIEPRMKPGQKTKLEALHADLSLSTACYTHEWALLFSQSLTLPTLWPCKASYYDFARTFSDDSNCRAATYKTCAIAAKEFVQNLMIEESSAGLDEDQEE